MIKMFTGREAHVMTFEVGAALEDAKWQAPVYCFGNIPEAGYPISATSRENLLGGVLRGSLAL
jgi:hypothetical protein